MGEFQAPATLNFSYGGKQTKRRGKQKYVRTHSTTIITLLYYCTVGTFTVEPRGTS